MSQERKLRWGGQWQKRGTKKEWRSESQMRKVFQERENDPVLDRSRKIRIEK